MARSSVKDILKRFERAIADRDLNRGTFNDAYDLILPYRNSLTNRSDNSYNLLDKQF